MTVHRSLIPLALALVAAGCSDGIGPHPTAVQQPPGQAPHFVRWAGGVRPQFGAPGAVSGQGDRFFLVSSSGVLSLDQYTATFWAVRGEPRSIQINYLSSTGELGSPFFQLAGVDPAYSPDRGSLALGDSVLITVTIDADNIGVSLEPAGLQLTESVQFQISYAGAGGDLNGDGIIDDTDAWVESRLLGISYRDGAAWTKVPAVQSVADASFSTGLARFSEYAVSW